MIRSLGNYIRSPSNEIPNQQNPPLSFLLFFAGVSSAKLSNKFSIVGVLDNLVNFSICMIRDSRARKHRMVVAESEYRVA